MDHKFASAEKSANFYNKTQWTTEKFSSFFHLQYFKIGVKIW